MAIQITYWPTPAGVTYNEAYLKLIPDTRIINSVMSFSWFVYKDKQARDEELETIWNMQFSIEIKDSVPASDIDRLAIMYDWIKSQFDTSSDV